MKPLKSIIGYARGVRRMGSTEPLERLIHIESKVDELLQWKKANQTMSALGHPDQLFGGRTYSQHGEDLVVASLFHRLGIERPDYLDIGAHHPFNISNTALLYLRGSRGINVEANPVLAEAFRSARPDDINLNVGVGPVAGILDFYMIDERSGRNSFSKEAAESFVREHPEFSIREIRKIPVTTVERILQDHYDGRCPAFLSIDTEGFDYSILQSIDFSKYRPAAICAEVSFSGAKQQEDEIISLLRQADYFPYYMAIGNILFVDEAYRHKSTSAP